MDYNYNVDVDVDVSCDIIILHSIKQIISPTDIVVKLVIRINEIEIRLKELVPAFNANIVTNLLVAINYDDVIYNLDED